MWQPIVRASCNAAKSTKAGVTQTPAAHQNAGGWRVAPQPPASWHRQAVLERASVRGAVGVTGGALAVGLAVLPLVGVHAAIGPRHGALAVVLAVFSLAGVLGAAGSAAVEVGWP